MDMAEHDRLSTRLRGTLRRDEPMAKHVSWRAGGKARTFYQPADVADLATFVRSMPAGEKVLFVGLGSNLLVRDGGFAGTVLLTHHALSGITQEADRGERLVFTAGAGVPAPHLARFVAKHGGAGAEWMAGIPGTVGGALAMNAGCYGGEMWDHVESVTVLGHDGEFATRTRDDYEIGYRRVVLKLPYEEWFISATVSFARGDETVAMRRIKELLMRRVATQPLSEPNAGSVFRNPDGDHAARLIEACGLKGYAVGGAQVSTKHANFIVNKGGASAADIEAVIDHVQKVVWAREGADLAREVHIVGDRA